MVAVISVCPSCGTKNNVPAEHLADTGRCGKCKGALPPAGEPIQADATLFNVVVAGAKVPIFVDFWAAWCGPCRAAAPEVHKLAQAMSGKALVLKVDTEAEPGLAARFHIQSIPNFVILKNGHPVFQRAGLASASEMRNWIESVAVSGR
jgi:thioredoxin 2